MKRQTIQKGTAKTEIQQNNKRVKNRRAGKGTNCWRARQQNKLDYLECNAGEQVGGAESGCMSGGRADL